MAKNEEPKWKWLVPVLGWAAVALFVVGVGAAVYSYRVTSGHEDWLSPGSRGDFWGGHFAAVAGLIGVILMFVAVRLQSQELFEQRKELKHAREAVEKQAVALEAQTEKLQTQNEMAQQRDDLNALNTMIQIAVTYEMAALREVDTQFANSIRQKVRAIGASGLRFIFLCASKDERWGSTIFRHYLAAYPFPSDFPVDPIIQYAWDGVEEPAKRALRETEWENTVRNDLRLAMNLQDHQLT